MVTGWDGFLNGYIGGHLEHNQGELWVLADNIRNICSQYNISKHVPVGRPEVRKDLGEWIGLAESLCTKVSLREIEFSKNHLFSLAHNYVSLFEMSGSSTLEEPVSRLLHAIGDYTTE